MGRSFLISPMPFEDRNIKTQKIKSLCYRVHRAAEPQTKEITPSQPSPLEGEGWGGGDAFSVLSVSSVARKFPEINHAF